MVMKNIFMLCLGLVICLIGVFLWDGIKITDAKTKSVVIDVRTPDAYLKEHLKGAINIPFFDIETKIENIVPIKETPIYLYWRNGRTSTISAEKLKNMGYTAVYNMGAMQNAQEQLKIDVIIK